MGRRRLTAEDLKFRAEVATKLDQARKALGLNQTEAATELGVTRQAFSQYVRKRATPQAAILARAATKWSLTLSYRGQEFAPAAFGRDVSPTTTETDGLQMELFDRPQFAQNKHLVVI